MSILRSVRRLIPGRRKASPAEEPSAIEMISREVDKEITLHHQTWESMSARAGILVGFAAALAGLSLQVGSFWWMLPGQVVAIAAAALSFRVWARVRFPVLDAGALARKYTARSPSEVRKRVYDARLRQWNDLKILVNKRSARLDWATKTLMLATVLLMAGAAMSDVTSDREEVTNDDRTRSDRAVGSGCRLES